MKNPIPQEWIDKYKKHEATIADIHAATGIYTLLVSYFLKQAGCDTRANRGRGGGRKNGTAYAIPPEWVQRWKEEKWTVTELASRMNEDYRKVWAALKRAGEVTKPNVRHPAKWRKRERNLQMFEEYQQGKSVGVVAKKNSISRQAVGQAIKAISKEKGILLRPRGKLKEDLYRRDGVKFSQEIMDAYCRGDLSCYDLAEGTGLKPESVRNALGNQPGYTGCKLMYKSKQRQMKAEEVYGKFMTGATMPELMTEYDCTQGSIEQLLVYHRRRTGAPPKKGWQKGTRKKNAS